MTVTGKNKKYKDKREEDHGKKEKGEKENEKGERKRRGEERGGLREIVVEKRLVKEKKEEKIENRKNW